MIYLAFALSFAGSAYSLWRAHQSRCDQREANLALGVLPLAIALALYFDVSHAEKILGLIMVFMGGIGIASERGFFRLIPIYQVIFAIWVMIGMVNSAPEL